jgi:hypothetical protein
MIQNADPTADISSDPPELASFEGLCRVFVTNFSACPEVCNDWLMAYLKQPAGILHSATVCQTAEKYIYRSAAFSEID